MALMEITKRTTRLIKGCGYMRYKAVDAEGEPFTTISLVWRFQQRLILAHAREGWYDGDKTNKLQFTRKGKTMYLKRIAIRIKLRKEWRQE